ncbi:SIR2 family protein [Cellulomonas sp. H30R-01]|uniref:SIR2 family NAD-dependent protein deacylase n=1 Tax=Cellulomonas sp. H30R-01 TaxID=2704467 RepID=UPI00138B2A17|nr:SIR2 family protein [Cellulomonas sp. H30R-01]QHT56047.1 SIR2 family protein [Cellulomonas sp. H30R-01]
MIDYGIDESDSSFLINAASAVSKSVRAIGDVAYANWLSSEVGTLTVRDSSLGKAISTLRFPILTTNYDTLIEDATGRGSTDWTDAGGVQSVLTRGSRDIGHLHGIWTKPESVVLSDEDYARILHDEQIQHLQRAFSTLTSVVFVGYGAGLSDPNFGKVLSWFRRTFPRSTATHFRLCLENELEALRAEHADENIEPVAYGKEHGDLPGFLSGLAPTAGTLTLSPAGIAVNPVVDAQSAMAESIVAEMLVTETVDDRSSVDIEQVVLPPILLPVPNPEYVRARKRRGASTDIDRIDPEKEVSEAEAILVVGDEESGLTTAIKWMAWKAAVNLGAAVPLYVNFKDCRSRPANPLRDALFGAALQAGIVGQKKDALPPYVLALDDFSPYTQRVSDKVLAELSHQEAIVVIIGCRQGTEDDTLERLRAAGLNPRTRFLGRLAGSDIRRLATYVAPHGAERLTRAVLDVLSRENLPRTPLSVSLLLSVLTRGGIIAISASQTTILDQYVSLLLGRGDPHEDARLGIEQVNREALLASLAEHFVNSGAGGLPEHDVVAELQRVIESYGWKESPTAILTNFVERRVLRRSGGNVVFGRSSYLYLFAAKRVSKSSEFRSALLAHPLLYSPILKAHAALVRHDGQLVDDLRSLLDVSSVDTESSPLYSLLELVDAPNETARTGDESSEAGGNEIGGDDVAFGEDERGQAWLDDVHDDSDRVPVFPADDPTEIPPGLRLLRSLDLVSTVLRDSDQVDDLELKKAVLEDTLATWGLLIPFLHEDSSFRSFTRTIASELEADQLIELEDEEAREAFVEDFSRAFPAIIALGGVQSMLASRKLVMVFERALKSGEFESSLDGRMGAAFFAFSVREPGWPAQLSTLLKDIGNRWIIREFLLYLLIESLFSDPRLSMTDAQSLRDLCVELITGAQRYRDDMQKKAHIAELRQDLDKRRRLRQARALGR